MEMDNLDTGTQTPASEDSQSTQSTAPAWDGPEWMSSMPDDIKGSSSLGKFKDVENLARGYMNAEKLLGRDKIPMPKTDAEFADVYAKLGCPADIKEYQVALGDIKVSDAMKESLNSDLPAFLEVAKASGLNSKQANTIFNTFAGYVSEIEAQQQANIDTEYAQAEAAIRAEYGEATPVKLNLANRMLSQMGGDELVGAIANSGLGRNPAFVKMMVKLGEMHAEELGIDKTGNANLMTPSNIKQQISDLQASPAYWDATHPDHRSTVDRVTQLFTRLSQQ